MLGIENAAHAEYGPADGAPLLVVPVACAIPDPAGGPRLAGRLRVRLAADSRAAHILEQTEIEEEFFCSYELNPAFQSQIAAGGLRLSGVAETGEARIVELPAHPFFLATAFLPQLSSVPERPHPLIVAFLQAADKIRAGRLPRGERQGEDERIAAYAAGTPSRTTLASCPSLG